MANVTQRIKQFLRSPAGRRLVQQAKHEMAKPQHRERLKALARKLTKRR